MKHSIFLTISGIAAFPFGLMMLIVPTVAAEGLGMTATPETLSLLRGMGGLIIGSGAMNFFVRNSTDRSVLHGVFLANVITHVLGLFADMHSILDGVLTVTHALPVIITHLFIGLGSLFFFAFRRG